jgi:hypothetical protein
MSGFECQIDKNGAPTEGRPYKLGHYRLVSLVTW